MWSSVYKCGGLLSDSVSVSGSPWCSGNGCDGRTALRIDDNSITLKRDGGGQSVHLTWRSPLSATSASATKLREEDPTIGGIRSHTRGKAGGSVGLSF
jgi:hypothetical protein